MTVRRLGLLLAVAALAAVAAPFAMSAGTFDAAPVARLPFPERGYVVSIPEAVSPNAASIVVRENGAPVRDVRVTSLSASGVRFGVVLLIDASLTMRGEPIADAMRAARAFAERRAPNQKLAIASFNREPALLLPFTSDGVRIKTALSQTPQTRYGTVVYDAVGYALDLLKASGARVGTVVLLSDGQNVGSKSTFEDSVRRLNRDNVRLFSVGLRTPAYDGPPLRRMAEDSNGAYFEVSDSRGIAGIYSALGRRLASEYLVRYRSDAPPKSTVAVHIAIDGLGAAAATYVAPTPTGIAPFHRSSFSRFILSSASVVIVAVLIAALVAWVLVLLVRGTRTDLAERIEEYSKAREAPAAPLKRELAAAGKALAQNRVTRGWLASLERDLEIARIDVAPSTVATATIGATVAAVLLLALVAPVVAVVGLGVPFLTRAIVRWRLRRVRGEFADQLPAALHVLASALRAGHSFSGALGVVVENVHEPARSELRRVVRDDQLGVLPEVALRRLRDRMANRDVEQVALLAELQRTAGGNSAEVIDTVVATIRQRGELRRLVRTLTAQGRMARWILTALPGVMTLFLWFMHPDTMGPFFASTGGQIALVVAVAMVAAGSMVIQRIVDIEV